MALVAKISAKSGKSVRTVVLRKGVNVLAAEADALVSVIDEATGKAVDAQLVRHDGEVRVSVADSYFTASDSALAAIDGAQDTPPAGGAGEAPPAEGSAGGEAAGGAAGGAGGAGGGSAALYGLLGAVALGGIAAGAGGGGGGGDKTPTPPADTTPPAAPTGLALATADDTGASNSDRITSQTSGLTISGTAEANATVTVLNGTTTLGTATANASGAFTLDVTLPAGTHSITATAKDAAGNAGPASAALSITVDTAGPAAPTALTLAAADDTGASATDGITSQTSGLTISGTAEANSVVTLRDGTTVLGTATANANGVFTLDASLAAGAHSITAIATDAAGNVSAASAALAITVDTTAPTVAIGSSLATILGAQTATLTFSFSEAPTGFTAADIVVTGGTVTNLAVSPNNPNVYTATLAATGNVAGAIGVSIAGATFTDAAGNASTAAASRDVAFDPGAQGQAIDGYIADALVFRDADNDGAWDHEDFTDANGNGLFDAGETYVDANSDGAFTGEFATRTDAEGNFSGLFGDGRIVLTPLIVNGVNVTRDISTGQTFTGKLAAPDGSTVVTPLTTLVEAVASAGVTVAEAQAQVKAALGISASVDITTLDPIAAVASGTGVADAVAVQKAATQVANILAVIGSASEAAGATGGKDAGVAAATSAIAAQIAGGAPVDLSSSAVIQQVAQSAANAAGGSAGATIAAQAAALGDSLANVNNAIAQASGDNAASTLAAVVSAQIVAQETLATEVSAAITNNQVLDSSGYEGAALAGKVDEAATQVEVVVPAPPPPPGAPGTPDRPVIDDGGRVSGAEATDGVVVTVAFGTAGNIAAGDTLRLMLGDAVAKDVVLTAGDIAARGVTVTLTAAELGADGAKSITAGFVSAAGAGNLSQPALFTLDTAAPAVPAGLTLAAADDTGLAGDGITSNTSALTVTGTAEADTTVTLRDGATVLGTATANAEGRFTLDVALAAGAHSLTATSTDAAGNASAASPALAITVDAEAPAAPSDIVPGEGGVLTGVEAADGTVIAGSTEAGSTVTFTFANGASTLVKDAEVTGTAFALSLTGEEIAALGEGAISYTATATDAAGNAGAASVAGRFVYTTQPIAAANVQIDTPELQVDDEHDDGVGVTPLRGGGFAVHWLVDGGDDEVDGIAIQRFGADGNRVGDIVVLSGIDSDLVNTESEDLAYDLTALENGGYALTYSLGLEEGSRWATVNGLPSGQAVDLQLVGRPHEFYVGSAPANASFALSGVDSTGAAKQVALTVEDGTISIDRSILDQFAFENRLTLRITGLTQGQAFNVGIDARQDVRYDPASALDGAETSFTAISVTTPAGQVGLGVIATGAGRPEAFEIESATYMNGTGPMFVNMVITPQIDGRAIDLSGAPGATLQANGQIALNGIAPDADGAYRVPPAILSQLGDGDFQAILLVGGLVIGSQITGTVGVREPIALPEGIFVQLFDAQGAALGDAGERIDIGEAPFASGDDQSVRVTALAGGGYAANWTVDVDGDNDVDLLGVQRFAADGSKVGDPILLTGYSTDLIDMIDDDAVVDLQALEGGGYALAYSQQLRSEGGMVTLPGGNPSFTFVGRPSYMSLASVPPGTTFTVSGLDADGTQKTVPVTFENGFFEFDSAFLSQFAPDVRLSLLATGIPANQAATIFIQVQADGIYDRSIPLVEVASTWTVPAANGVGIVFAWGDDNAEAFRIDSRAAEPTFVILTVTPPPGVGQFLALPPGATLLPNGSVQIVNPALGADGFYRVPESLLEQLGGRDFAASLVIGGQPAGSTVTGTVLLRESVDAPEGVFVQVFGPDGAALGDPLPRLDGGASASLLDEGDDGKVVVTPLTDGGFAVNWLVDADGDGESENIAVQRFAADGSKAGEVVVLQNIYEGLLDQIDEVGAYDFQALDNGGYALTYSLGLESSSRSFTLNQQFAQLNIVGRPSEIYVGSPPPNASFVFSGVGPNDTPVVFNLTPEDGFLRITQEMLDQLAVDNRGTITVTGLTQGQGISGYIETLEDVNYEGAPLVDAVSDRLVQANGIGVIAVSEGRPEAFRVDAMTGTPIFVTMIIAPIWGGQNINVQGIPNVFVAPSGTININDPVKDADGFYRVPQQILDQIDDNDLQAFMVFGGLTEGSQILGTVTVSVGTELKEGLFVQTFGPDGAPLFDGAEIIGTDGADSLIGDTGGDVIRGLGGGDLLSGGDGDDVLISGEGGDVMTGGAGADLFFLDAPAGQTLSLADLITDFQPGIDTIRLPGGVTYADVLVVQGDPATNGAAALDSLIVDTASGDILARMANTDAAAVTQASFM